MNAYSGEKKAIAQQSHKHIYGKVTKTTPRFTIPSSLTVHVAYLGSDVYPQVLNSKVQEPGRSNCGC